MQSESVFKKLVKRLVFVVAIFITTCSNAQTGARFEEHEVIEIGNGMKLEILRSRGEGANEEWDVIYYTDKRQLGKRKWEKTSTILELQQQAKIAEQKAKQDAKKAAKENRNTVNNKASENKATSKNSSKLKGDFKKDTLAITKNVQPANLKKQATPETKSNPTKLNAPETKAPVTKLPVQKPFPQKLSKNVGDAPNKNANERNKIMPPSTDSISPTITDVKKSPSENNVGSHAAPSTYTLARCYTVAIDKNISLKQAQNQITSSVLDRKIAQNNFLPSVYYNLGHYFYFGKNIDPVTNIFVHDNFSGGYTAVSMELQLFSGFSRVNAVKQSSYNIQAAEYSKKRAQLELLTNITLTYARLLLDKEQVELQRSNLRSTAKELEVINEKIKVGRLSKYEAFTFSGRLNTQQANLVTIQNDSLAASQDLKQLLNLSFKEGMEIAPIDTTELANIYATNISSADFVEDILKQHPAIKQAEMQKDAAKLSEQMSKSGYYPTLSIDGNLASNYNTNQTGTTGAKVPLYNQLNNNLGQNVNINLHIPIFSQLQNSNRVKKERINTFNAQLALDEARNIITTNTLQLINDFNAAREKYMATRSAWEQNSLSYNLYEEKYKLGQISSMELLLAQDTQNAATAQYLQSKLQLYFQYHLLQLLKG